ncbi:hypothetical protein LZ30DRAFT_199713 [Colletotrichum cereale]|nr:hypothetical protein LZ30DRAFT_199713 [Colletotrichum cereale]
MRGAEPHHTAHGSNKVSRRLGSQVTPRHVRGDPCVARDLVLSPSNVPPPKLKDRLGSRIRKRRPRFEKSAGCSQILRHASLPLPPPPCRSQRRPFCLASIIPAGLSSQLGHLGGGGGTPHPRTHGGIDAQRDPLGWFGLVIRTARFSFWLFADSTGTRETTTWNRDVRLRRRQRWYELGQKAWPVPRRWGIVSLDGRGGVKSLGPFA